MIVKIDVEYDDSAIRRALDNLRAAGEDLSPVMRVIAGHLEDSVAESFEREGAPDGSPWAPLRDSTKKQRRKRGYRDGPILERSGDLGGSITSGSDHDSAVAGTNLVYAATHQFGAEKGAFGTTSRGTPIPWGPITARPFLGVWPEHAELITDAVLDHLAKALRR